MVPAVLLGRVPDHLPAEALVEVHVDVGHLLATRIEEALEEEVVPDGIEVDDLQAVGDAAAGGRAPARAHADAALAGVTDQVPHHEEIRREPHVGDDAELVVETADDLGREGLAVTATGTVEGEMAQVLVLGGEGSRYFEARELGLAELDVDLGPFRHPQRVVARLGDVAKEVAHLGRRLQVVLLGLEAEALGIVDGRPGLDAQQGVVGDSVFTVGVVAVVGGEQGRAQPLGDVDELGVGALLLLQPVVLQLHEEVVGPEDVLEAAGQLVRPIDLALKQRLEHYTAQAAGGGDDAVVVALEQLPVDSGSVVVALEEGLGRELDEVAVALGGLGQEGEVVVELLALRALTAGVVQPTPPYRPLEPRVGRLVGLEADHGVQALGPGLLVEVEDPVHVPVVGDPDGGLAVGGGGGDDLVDTGRSVEHGEL